nr:Uncharacterised protein [Salmonella enterica subsp. enterica serovar Typhi]
MQIGTPQQAVAVWLTNIIKSKFFLFMNGVFVRHIVNQGLAEQRHIASGTELPWRIKAVYRLEGCIG